MPVIKQYERRVGSQNIIKKRERTADDFGALEGKAMAEVGRGVTNFATAVHKRQEQREVSELGAELSRAQAEDAIEYQDLTRNVENSDDKRFEDFEKRSKERLDTIGSKASTPRAKEYFNSASVKMSARMKTSTEQLKVQIDGERAVSNYEDTVNNLSAGLISDPSGFDGAKETLSGQNNILMEQGLISKSDADKLTASGTKTLIKSQIRGWAKLNPTYAREKLKTKGYDKVLGPDTKMQLLGEIAQAERGTDLEAKRQELKNKELRDLEIKETQNDFLEKMHKNELTAKDILDSNLDPVGTGSQKQFLNMLEASNNAGGKLKTNPGVYLETFRKIHLDDDDPEKITSESQLNDLVVNGLISPADLGKLRNEISGNGTAKGKIEGGYKKQLMNVAKTSLVRTNSLTGIRDPKGEENLLRFQYFVDEEIEEQKRLKKPLKDLFNPNHKDYVGHHINNYKRTMTEIMKDQAGKIRGKTKENLEKNLKDKNPENPKNEKPPAKRLPGESAAAFLERTK